MATTEEELIIVFGITAFVPRGSLFELLENALLAFVFAGVFWNVAAGYDLVAETVVPAAIVLTLALLFALFSVDTLRRQYALERPR
ncbi:hypothetical protein BRC86_05610 [Halobacteriales archaeon QS_3_64_16]|nr:MAG: hypothetical protein BRC86_05610 [Halobacteriales archaeon QS_3_64_16]